MNSKDRYLATIGGKCPDFVPRTPILMQFAAEFIGSNYGAFAADYRVLAEANLRCAEHFGIDQVSAISDPYRETQGFGAEIVFEKNSVPRCVEPPLFADRNLDDLPAVEPLRSERMLDRINAVKTYKETAGEQYSVLGWVEGPAAEAADLRDVSNFLMDILDDETYAGELMDRCVDVGIAFATAQIQAGADTIGIGDAIASQLSPDLYERLVQPREKRLVKAIQQQGAYVKLHICGDITHLLPGIGNLGIDILDVDHMVDIVKVRQTVGTHTVITGNIDPVAGILQGTPQSIRNEIRKIYQSIGNPYMVNAGCEIPSGTPEENLLALCEPVV